MHSLSIAIWLLSEKSILYISFKYFTLKDKVVSSVLSIGVPASLNSLLMSLSNIVLNSLLASYGDLPVAAMGVAMKVNMIVVLLQIGLGQEKWSNM